MSLALMPRRANLILFAAALAQAFLLGLALLALSFHLDNIRASVHRLGVEEQDFLARLAAAEHDSLRTSILLRDSLFLPSPENLRARDELSALLARISASPLSPPASFPSDLAAKLHHALAAQNEFLDLSRNVLRWNDSQRRSLAPQFISQQLAPSRQKLLAATRESADLLAALHLSRTQSFSASLEYIHSLTVRVLAGAIVLSLAIAAAAILRFRRYERERNQNLLSLSTAEDRLRSLSQRLVVTQEQERKRISRELHDEVGQSLTALRVQLGQVEPANPASQTHLDQAASLADRSLKTVRQMSRGLRPAMLDDLGLAPALQWLGRDVSRNTCLEVDVHIEGEFAGVDEPTRTCMYRVTQEALTNCVRHSGAPAARVVLHESPHEFLLTIQDAGCGFSPGAASGVGLLGMRERVEELGGRFAVVSSPGAGTLIRVHLPRPSL